TTERQASALRTVPAPISAWEPNRWLVWRISSIALGTVSVISTARTPPASKASQIGATCSPRSMRTIAMIPGFINNETISERERMLFCIAGLHVKKFNLRLCLEGRPRQTGGQQRKLACPQRNFLLAAAYRQPSGQHADDLRRIALEIKALPAFHLAGIDTK